MAGRQTSQREVELDLDATQNKLVIKVRWDWQLIGGAKDLKSWKGFGGKGGHGVGQSLPIGIGTLK